MRSTRFLALIAVAGAVLGPVPAAPALAIPPPRNLVANGGFDTGGLAPWSCEHAHVLPAPGAPGRLAAVYGVTSNNSTGRCTQTVTVRPNSSYLLSAWLRGSHVMLGVIGYGSPTIVAATGPVGAMVRKGFTTGPGTTTVEVYVSGWYARGPYHADGITLFGPEPRPLQTPTGLTVTGTTSRSVQLRWQPVAGAAGYRVYLDGGTLIHDTSGPATSATAFALSPSSTYRLRVAAYHTLASSARSEAVTATTLADAESVPYPPRSVVASAGPGASLWLAWEAVEPASRGYGVYVDGTLVRRVYGPAFHLDGLARDRTYRIEVTAFNGNGESARSRPVYGTTLIAGAPPPPA